jgi:uncharacterized protein
VRNAVRDGRGSHPLFMVQGGQVVDLAITRIGPDSMLLAIGPSQMRVHISPTGELLSGESAAQRLRFERGEAQPVAVHPSVRDYSAPASAPYTAVEIGVPAPAGHVLAGTLTRPITTGRVPAVVLITGSGPQERDSRLPGIGEYQPFREIADTLSRRGIAVLRLDDRGIGASTGEFGGATTLDFADDARAAVAYLRSRSDIDPERIGLVGHSEGGIIAPLVAADDPRLAAIVLIAGTAVNGREIVRQQQRFAHEQAEGRSTAQLDSALAAAFAAIERQARESPWLRHFLDHDPLPAARRVRVPALVLHGETDRQVPVEQAATLSAALREGGASVTLRTLPGVNHLLLRDEDGSPGGYAGLPDHGVVPEALGVLADWLAEHLSASRAAGGSGDAFLDDLVAWLEVVNADILREGRPLPDDLQSIAAEIGIAHLDSIRVLRVEDVPVPPADSALYSAGAERGLWGPTVRGNAQVFGHGIAATDEVLADRGAIAHELMHVRQVERCGGIEAFVAEYLHQVARHGYRGAPLEREAFRMNERFAPADPGTR